MASKYGFDQDEKCRLHLITHFIENFIVTQALECPKRGYTQTKHSDLRGIFSKFLSEISYDIEVNPRCYWERELTTATWSYTHERGML